MARNSANIASKDKATARNGSESSQMKGQSTSTKSATGQHTTSKINHISTVFTMGFPFNS